MDAAVRSELDPHVVMRGEGRIRPVRRRATVTAEERRCGAAPVPKLRERDKVASYDLNITTGTDTNFTRLNKKQFYHIIGLVTEFLFAHLN